MRSINQKTFCLIAEAISASKATSNPDQAVAIVEFGNVCDRLNCMALFPNEYALVKPVLNAGYAAFFAKCRRDRMLLPEIWASNRNAFKQCVPEADVDVVATDHERIGDHPDEVARILTSGTLGKKMVGWVAGAALGTHLKIFMLKEVQNLGTKANNL